MKAAEPYEPDDDDVLVHRFTGARYVDAYFSVGTNYGHGQPQFYVALDEDGGERYWWLDPAQANELGRRLVEFAADCRRRNYERSAE